MHRYLIVGAVAAVLLAPAGGFLATPAQAQASSDWQNLFGGDVGLLRIEVGPDAVLFHVDDIQLKGRAAQELRHALDNLPSVGNGDGEVSEGERRAFEAFLLTTLNAGLPSSFDLDIATIDGKAPFRGEERPLVQVRTVKISGAEGDVLSTAPITAAVSVLLYFESVDQSLSAHMVRFENVWGDLVGVDASDAPPVEVRVSGYKSWTIQAESISPATMQERLDGDTLVITASDLGFFKQQGSGVEFQMRGDPSDRILVDAEESPAPALFAFVVLALVGIGALRRRR